MAVSYTYDELVAELKDYLEDEFDDFDAQVDALIGLGELRLLRDLDLEFLDTTDTGQTTSASSDALSKPNNTIAVRSVFVNRQPLEQRAWAWVEDYNTGASDGQPLYWAEKDETTLVLAPPADSSYSTVIRANVRPDGLSSGNSNTWFGDNLGDVLLYACLVEAERYVDDAPNLQMWQQAYAQEKLPGAQAELRRQRRADYRPLAAQPQPVPKPNDSGAA
jgi:hypothetical protein